MNKKPLSETAQRSALESLPGDSPLICPPFDIRPQRPLYPFQGHRARRDGMNLHYLDEGNGEPLVLVHGNPTWSFYYRKLVASLCPRYRVIVPYHMGCGLSSRPSEDAFTYTLESHVNNLEDLLDHLGLTEKVTLIAHDWGGMIGMGCACRKPERIARIVLLNTGAFLIPEGKRLPWQLSLIKNQRALAALLVRGLNAFSLGATFLGTLKGMKPDVRRAYTAPYNNWRNRIATLRFVQDIPASPADRSFALARWIDGQLGRFEQTPKLICWGEGDFVFDAKILSEWCRRFPGAEVHTFPRAGHYVLEDEPEAVTEKIVDFLERHPL